MINEHLGGVECRSPLHSPHEKSTSARKNHKRPGAPSPPAANSGPGSACALVRPAPRTGAARLRRTVRSVTPALHLPAPPWGAALQAPPTLRRGCPGLHPGHKRCAPVMRPPLGRRQQPRLIAARPGRLPRGCACCAAPALRAAACAPPCRGRPAPVTRGLVRPPPPRCAPALRRGGGSVSPAARAVAAHLRGNLFSALWAPPAAVCGRACACPCGPPGSPPAASNRRPGAAGPPLLARRAAARRCAAARLALVPPAPPLERGIAALLTAFRWRRLLGFFAPPGLRPRPPSPGGLRHGRSGQ